MNAGFSDSLRTLPALSFPFLFHMVPLLKCPSALLLLALLFAAAPYTQASTEEEFDPFHEGQDL